MPPTSAIHAPSAHPTPSDHGDDKFILADYTLLPTILKIAPQLPKLQGIIVLTDR
jgi:hypothetical protein